MLSKEAIRKIKNIGSQSTVKIVLPTLGEGSGVIVNKYRNSFTVLTNKHVVSESEINFSEDIQIITEDGKTHIADKKTYLCFGVIKKTKESKIKNENDEIDIALIKFYSRYNYNVPEIREDKDLSEGDQIFSLGYRDELMIPEHTIRFIRGNIISIAEENQLEGIELFFDGPLVHGMSGGPIFNEDGKLIGINQGGEKDPVVSDNFETGVQTGVPIKYYNQLLNKISEFGTDYNLLEAQDFESKRIEENLRAKKEKLFQEEKRKREIIEKEEKRKKEILEKEAFNKKKIKEREIARKFLQKQNELAKDIQKKKNKKFRIQLFNFLKYLGNHKRKLTILSSILISLIYLLSDNNLHYKYDSPYKFAVDTSFKNICNGISDVDRASCIQKNLKRNTCIRLDIDKYVDPKIGYFLIKDILKENIYASEYLYCKSYSILEGEKLVKIKRPIFISFNNFKKFKRNQTLQCFDRSIYPRFITNESTCENIWGRWGIIQKKVWNGKYQKNTYSFLGKKRSDGIRKRYYGSNKTKLMELETGFGPKKQGNRNLNNFIDFKTRINYVEKTCMKILHGINEKKCLRYKNAPRYNKFVF